jgi:hypothetical protein
LRALRAGDDRLLSKELRLLATKHQIAVVRALAKEFERRVGDAGAVQTTLAGHLAKSSLGWAAAVWRPPLR